MSVDKHMHVDDLTWHSILKHVPNVAPWNTVDDLAALSVSIFSVPMSPVTRLVSLATSVLAKKRRTFESEQECQLRRDSDRKCKAMKGAIEIESETVAHRASNRMCTANKRLVETDSETVACRANNRLCTANKRPIETESETIACRANEIYVLLTRELLRLRLKPNCKSNKRASIQGIDALIVCVCVCV